MNISIELPVADQTALDIKTLLCCAVLLEQASFTAAAFMLNMDFDSFRVEYENWLSSAPPSIQLAALAVNAASNETSSSQTPYPAWLG